MTTRNGSGGGITRDAYSQPCLSKRDRAGPQSADRLGLAGSVPASTRPRMTASPAANGVWPTSAPIEWASAPTGLPTARTQLNVCFC